MRPRDMETDTLVERWGRRRDGGRREEMAVVREYIRSPLGEVGKRAQSQSPGHGGPAAQGTWGQRGGVNAPGSTAGREGPSRDPTAGLTLRLTPFHCACPSA